MKSEVNVGFGFTQWGMIFVVATACSFIMEAVGSTVKDPVMTMVFGILTAIFMIASAILLLLGGWNEQ